MEEHKFKLCLKSLANARGLGSHTKSNTLNLQESESASYSSSEGKEKGNFYGFRENPKRCIRLVDTEVVDADSLVLRARGSETEWSESSKNPTRRRSKRAWRTLEQQEEIKKLKVNNNQPSQNESCGTEPEPEPEPVSSISDVAFCLMMLSRDQWKSEVSQDDDDYEYDDDETDESEYTTTVGRGKYRCQTCNEVFNSYQALGGHRASHKKIKAYETELAPENMATCSMKRKKARRHECPVCFRVFSSGQALGGHKRSHITSHQVAATTTTTTETCVKSSKMLVLNLIDLNLPAPVDEDDDDGFLMLK